MVGAGEDLLGAPRSVPGQLLVLRVMPTTLGRQTRVPICRGSPSPIDDGAPRVIAEITKTQRPMVPCPSIHLVAGVRSMKASTQYKVSIVYSVACSALECSVAVLPDMRTIIAGAAERGRVKEGFKLDCGVVLVIALSLRTASCHFEQFAQTVEADSQPCLNEGLAKKKKKKKKVWDDDAVVDRPSCRASDNLCGIGTDKDINRQHMFVCLSYTCSLGNMRPATVAVWRADWDLSEVVVVVGDGGRWKDGCGCGCGWW